jgi:hypothetical protein
MADVLERMHGSARQIAGFPISVHGLILLASREELPADKRSQWLNVDGVACLVSVFPEQHLPLKSDLDNHLAFAMLIHESVDMGIKKSIFTRSPSAMDWRWWLEGLAEYCASQACREHQPAAFRFARQGYLKKLDSFSGPTIDLLAEATWFPEGYQGPDDAACAYTASHFLIAQMAQRHSTAWIGKALLQYQRELDENPNPDFLAIVASLTGEDLHEVVCKVKAEEVRRFAESLGQGPAGRRRSP